MNEEVLELFTDYIDEEGFVQRFDYDKHRYYNTGINLKGKTGSPGRPGRDGKDGITPHIDPTSKHWMIGTTDTGIVAEGQNGADGTNGTNGTNGTDGITPTVNVTSITGGHNVAFSYGSGDSRNTDFNVMDGINGQGVSQVQADWNQNDNTAVDYIKNKPTIPAAQVQADWNASSGMGEILNKPDLSNYVQTSNTAGLLKNDGTVDTNTYLTSVPNTCVTSTTSNLKIEVVAALPASPDANTIYIVQ